MKRFKKLVSYTLLSLMIFVLCIPILVMVMIGGSFFYNKVIWPQSFTQEKWQALSPKTEQNPNRVRNQDFTCQRGRLVDDLIKKHLKIGQSTKVEVLNLLDTDDEKSQPSPGGKNCYEWLVGWCSLMDPDFLQACFDETNILISANQIQG